MVAVKGNSNTNKILNDYVSFKPPQIPGSQKYAAGCILKPAPLSIVDVRSMTCVRERWKRDECNYPNTSHQHPNTTSCLVGRRTNQYENENKNIHIGLFYAPPDKMLPSRLEAITACIAQRDGRCAFQQVLDCACTFMSKNVKSDKMSFKYVHEIFGLVTCFEIGID
ncbi:unnamed protein product, partial [Brenthis ino]